MSTRGVWVTLHANTQQYEAGMKRAQAATANVTGSTDRLSAGTQQTSTEMGNAAGTIRNRVLPALAGAVGGLQLADKTFRAGFTRLTNLEDAEKRFEQMGVSVGETDNLMDGLNDTLIDTPFKLDAGADAMSRFVASGMDVDDVNQNFELMADAAAFAQVPLNELTHIWERVQSQGKLTGETLTMLQERGVPALSLLADAAGVSEERFREMISTGQVNAEMFFDLWAEGAKGFGDDNIEMEGAAKSMGDTVSGAAKNAETALARLGAAVLDDFMPAVRAGFDELKDDIDGVIARWDFATGMIRDTGALIPDDLMPGADDAEDQEGFWDKAVGAAKAGGEGVVSAVLPIVGIWGLVDDATEGATSNAQSSTESWMSQIRGAAHDALPAFSGALGTSDHVMGELANAAEDAADEIDRLTQSLFESGREAIELEEHQDALKNAIDEAREASEDDEASKQDQRAALRDVATESLDVIEAMIEQGKSTEDVTAVTENAREEFIKVAEQMGIDSERAEELADKYGLIPGEVETTVELIGDERAKARIAEIQEQLNILDGSSANYTITETRQINTFFETFGNQGRSGQMHEGGLVMHKGGAVTPSRILAARHHERTAP